MADYYREIDVANLWPIICQEAQLAAKSTPLLADFLQRHLLQHDNFAAALCYVLAEKLADSDTNIPQWQAYLIELLNAQTQQAQQHKSQRTIYAAAMADLLCQLHYNASIKDHFTPLLFFPGYQALQSYRFAHYCWHHDQRTMANFIQAKMITQFGVDIHPAAQLGCGIFLDHSVAVVIGETAVVEDNVTIFQSVTLGDTGKQAGDRHPKVRQGAFIGSGAVIYGNIEIGRNAKVGGGAIVVKDVAPNNTVTGVVAKPKGYTN